MAFGGGGQRERISLVIAIGVHVAAFVVARRAAVRVVPTAPEAASEIAVEVEEPLERTASSEPRPERAPPHPPAPSPMKGDAEPSPRSPLSVHARGAGAEATQSPGETPGEPGALSSSPPPVPIERPPSPPPVSLAQLGLEGPNRFLEAPAGAAPTWTIQDAEDGVRRSIADPLLKHDRSVGLGAEGPALAAIEEIAVASTAAVNGRAVLSLIADATGLVTRVSCVDGDHAQWDGVAADIAKALSNKRLRGVPGGRGVEMRIEVTSREQLPSGRDPGVEVRVLRIPVKRGRGPKSTRVDILNVDPKVVLDDPEVEGEGPSAQAAPVKFPKAHLELIRLFGLDGDPADIGVAARRVVHAKVLEEHPL